MDLRVFVDTAADLRLLRRLRRDMRDRGRSAESVIEQYERTVRPMHREFVEPSKRHADLLVPEGGHNRVAVDLVVAKVRNLLVARGFETG
jgi:uridine kinase